MADDACENGMLFANMLTALLSDPHRCRHIVCEWVSRPLVASDATARTDEHVEETVNKSSVEATHRVFDRSRVSLTQTKQQYTLPVHSRHVRYECTSVVDDVVSLLWKLMFAPFACTLVSTARATTLYPFGRVLGWSIPLTAFRAEEIELCGCLARDATTWCSSVTHDVFVDESTFVARDAVNRALEQGVHRLALVQMVVDAWLVGSESRARTTSSIIDVALQRLSGTAEAAERGLQDDLYHFNAAVRAAHLPRAHTSPAVHHRHHDYMRRYSPTPSSSPLSTPPLLSASHGSIPRSSVSASPVDDGRPPSCTLESRPLRHSAS